MHKLIFCFLVIFIFSPATANAQIIDGYQMDSMAIRFNGGSNPNLVPDTSANPLWQVGLTHKLFFATDTFGTVAMMTDTLHHYPINSNNSFVLIFPPTLNMIVDIWHRYETDSTHAGGIVEFSTDHGSTWQNLKGGCNVDSLGSFVSGTRTSNFYSFADTLFNGEPAFKGTSSGSRYSRFQLFSGYPVKSLTASCSFYDSVFVRFRFVSDTTADTLAGWMIDSVKMERDEYPGGIVALTNQKNILNIFPNPSPSGQFSFPDLSSESGFYTEIYNMLGSRLYVAPYMHEINLSHCPDGIYFYRVSNGNEYYFGKLLKE